MVIAASITAILIVTFRIPGGAIGALSAFLLSRESLQSTAQSALALGSAFVIGGLFIPIGSRFFASVPITHFLWEGISLFIVFFLLRTLTNFLVAINIGAIATAMFAIWYLPGPGEKNVELSLWQVLAALIGAVVTFAVEVVFHAIRRSDDVVVGVDVRLQQIEALMEDYAANRPVSPETSRMLAQYAVVGVGALRRELARRHEEAIQRMRTSAMVSLTGRAIDFAAALSSALSRFRLLKSSNERHNLRRASLRYVAACRQMKRRRVRRPRLAAEVHRCSMSWKLWSHSCRPCSSVKARSIRDSKFSKAHPLLIASLSRTRFPIPSTCRLCSVEHWPP